MPIFEYYCLKCQSKFETLVLSGDRQAPVCPLCGSSEVEKLISAGAVRPHGIPSGGGGWNLPKCAASGSG